ncbi:MAG: LolA-related protein [Gammaproteobacteria bacterium]
MNTLHALKSGKASGLTSIVALMALAVPVWASGTPAPAGFSAAQPLSIVRRLAKQPPTQTPFVQAQFSPLLDRALVLKGQLVWDGGQKLERIVEQPYSGHTVIAGTEVSVTRAGHGTKKYSLNRAPAMKALLDGLIAVLSGDPGQLRGVFNATLQGRSDAYWTLLLVPHEAKLAHDLKQLTLDGYAGTLRCIEIHQNKGAASIYVLGKLASRVTGRPTQPALKKLCRAG